MLDLLDYRRRVAEMYRVVRELGTGAPEAHAHLQPVRDELLQTHSTMPITHRVTTIRDGFARWRRHRTSSIFPSLLER